MHCYLQLQDDFTQNRDSSLVLGAHSQGLKKEKRQTTVRLFPQTRHCDALADNFSAIKVLRGPGAETF